MLKNVPRGEAVSESDGRPASFYVIEPRDMGIELTQFNDYQIKI